MELIGFFNEGQVYEVLLVTRSNVTPVGVVRKGNRLFFKLFGGKSREDIQDHPRASIQVTNDAELIVKLALNFPVQTEFKESDGYRWIAGLPGVYGRVEFMEEPHNDELGSATVLECSLTPEGEIDGTLPPRPISRADFHLIEMAVHLTRLLVAVRKGKLDVAKRLHDDVMLNYLMYKRFGGRSEVAKRMVETAEASFGQNSTETPAKESL
ncbi:DUF447 domain-containing protein [Thermococcus thioreducens]|uniref:DUF447 domain-containing protein n=1 Tax=Thermococcus thioreducens TaxID=277988 RepID=A0A0Q2REA5_9EURY|nr:DUF447 domain-containing protein [Thermococcus thioreducens]ASJ12843.1 hypothetical protein A3L14_08080 [Thermococcus thioreducens]KQH82310.1 hypothetical protein AMR53_06840 [Thermococcus thioreducens]SEV84431.1 hypothetical protein SAMN05216170_0329 [Thermococcus thioreducens]